MKYSTGLFSDKTTVSLEKKITKLSSRSLSTNSEKITKIQKQLVDNVVDNPDFNETVQSLSSYAQDYGSDSDKKQFATLKRKIKSGAVEYNDVQELYSLGSRNYKHFFKGKPSFAPTNPVVIIGFFIAVFAVILRCCADENTNLVLMCAINILAIGFTTFTWPNAVRTKLTAWFEANGIPKVIYDKLVTPVVQKTRFWVAIFFIACIAFLWFSHWWTNLILGNDILSVISLSTAVLSDNIVIALVNLFQLRIYYNKER